MKEEGTYNTVYQWYGIDNAWHSLATGFEQDDFGATPVHDAAEQGQLECLYVFYNHSVDLNQQDSDGFTPM